MARDSQIAYLQIFLHLSVVRIFVPVQSPRPGLDLEHRSIGLKLQGVDTIWQALPTIANYPGHTVGGLTVLDFRFYGGTLAFHGRSASPWPAGNNQEKLVSCQILHVVMLNLLSSSLSQVPECRRMPLRGMLPGTWPHSCPFTPSKELRRHWRILGSQKQSGTDVPSPSRPKLPLRFTQLLPSV